jgi:hypothetical protein
LTFGLKSDSISEKLRWRKIMKTIETDLVAVKSYLENAVRCLGMLEKDIGTPEKIFLKKTDIATRYDISTEQIDKMIRCRILIEEAHFTRFVPGGAPMFYVAACDEALKPKHSEKKR